MEIFKGWYRKSFTKGRWHRINQVDLVLGHRKMGITICGRRIPSTHSDYSSHPDSQCAACKRHEDNIEFTLQREKVFALFQSRPMTRSLAIHHLRKLIKPHEYLVEIWDNWGIKIEANWVSDTSIDIDVTNISTEKTKTVTLQQTQEDLSLFRSAIEYLIAEIDELACQSKKKNKTEYEKQEFFEELLEIAEKQNA